MSGIQKWKTTLTYLEHTVSTRSFSVDDALGDPLAVKVSKPVVRSAR